MFPLRPLRFFAPFAVKKIRKGLFDTASISKPIMFPYGFLDVPSATHPLGKDHEVAFAYCYRLTAAGCYGNFAFNNQAGFLFVVVPREDRRFLAPSGPRAATELGECFGGWIVCYFYLHGVKSSL